MTTKVKPAPTLDKERTIGTIYSSDGTDGESPRFYQDGHYFTGSGKYLYTDEGAKKVSKPVAAKASPLVNAMPAVTDEGEIEELLTTPAAEELLQLDRDALVEMVREQGGPVLSGDSSQRMMAAWIVKGTLSGSHAQESISTEEATPEVA